MKQSAWGLGIVLLLGAALPASAGPIDGNWKLTLQVQNQPTLWLLQFATKDDQLTGSVLGKAEDFPDSEFESATLKDDLLHLVLKLRTPQKSIKMTFDGKLDPKVPKKVFGSVQFADRIFPAVLEATPLTAFDTFELSKEALASATGGQVFETAVRLLKQSGDKKAKPDEVRAWAAKAAKASEPYGAVWQREVALQIAEALIAGGGDLAKEGLPYARQAERLLAANDPPALQKRALTALAAALEKAGKEDEAKEIEARLAKMSAGVQPIKFAGRKGKSDRVVLVELFTGAECPPCVAADLAFDGIASTFQPADVVLLQYHLHIPGPDPLTNADTEKRQRYYGDDIGGTPTAFFNGKVGAPGGGGTDDGQEKYEEFLEVIKPLLETDSKVTLKLSATRQGDLIDITAQASDLMMPGEKVRLRLVLVEDQVEYKGRNKVPHHRHVVRAFPGGQAGVALTEKTGKATATVNVEELRKKLKDYLDEFDKDSPFPNKDRPLEMKKLRVVAFVQNDATREVLQAVQVDLSPAKAE